MHPAVSRASPATPLTRLTGQHDDPDPEVRLAALLADAELHRDRLTVGQHEQLLNQVRALLDDIVNAQPYRRRELDALASWLDSYITGDVTTAAAVAEQHYGRPDVPGPVHTVLSHTAGFDDTEEAA